MTSIAAVQPHNYWYPQREVLKGDPKILKAMLKLGPQRGHEKGGSQTPHFGSIHNPPPLRIKNYPLLNINRAGPKGIRLRPRYQMPRNIYLGKWLAEDFRRKKRMWRKKNYIRLMWKNFSSSSRSNYIYNEHICFET